MDTVRVVVMAAARRPHPTPISPELPPHLARATTSPELPPQIARHLPTHLSIYPSTLRAHPRGHSPAARRGPWSAARPTLPAQARGAGCPAAPRPLRWDAGCFRDGRRRRPPGRRATRRPRPENAGGRRQRVPATRGGRSSYVFLTIGYRPKLLEANEATCCTTVRRWRDGCGRNGAALAPGASSGGAEAP